MGEEVLIKGGIIVNSKNAFRADLLVRGEKIVLIGTNNDFFSSSTRIIDADGLYILPGAIDGHVHMMDPGYTNREDFITGTRAAARGGVTTVIEHHRTEPQVFNSKLFVEKKQYLKDRSIVDFALMGGLNLSNINQLEEMWKAGAVAFKGFTCSLHGAEALLSGDLLAIMQEVKRFDGIILLHCEDDSVLKRNESRLRAEKRRDPLLISEYRSPEAEILAVENVIRLSEMSGARVAIAHVSLPALAKAIVNARLKGARIYCESCAQYFTLTIEDLKGIGPFSKFTPPPRTKEDVKGMWESLATGHIDMVNSDHCPYPKEEKEAGLVDIWEAPFGIPGVETTTRLLLDAVAHGRIDIRKIAAVRSENPARIYGLGYRKGFLLPGYDADLILVDVESEQTLRDEDIVSKCKWTPFAGRRIKGDIITTMVRGEIVMGNREVIGRAGWGKFTSRKDL